MTVDRRMYVALIENATSSTLVSQPYALDLPFSRDAARHELQRFISKGGINQAGTYLICTPRETSVNGHLFRVKYEEPPDPPPSPYQIVD